MALDENMLIACEFIRRLLKWSRINDPTLSTVMRIEVACLNDDAEAFLGLVVQREAMESIVRNQTLALAAKTVGLNPEAIELGEGRHARIIEDHMRQLAAELGLPVEEFKLKEVQNAFLLPHWQRAYQRVGPAPRVMCRLCGRPVEREQPIPLANGKIAFTVWCHGSRQWQVMDVETYKALDPSTITPAFSTGDNDWRPFFKFSLGEGGGSADKALPSIPSPAVARLLGQTVSEEGPRPTPTPPDPPTSGSPEQATPPEDAPPAADPSRRPG